MKKTLKFYTAVLTIVALAVVALSACTAPPIAAPADSDTSDETGELQFDDLGEFSSIVMSAIGKATITQGETSSVKVTGSTDLLDKLNVFVEDGALHVELPESAANVLLKKKTISYEIVAPALDGISLLGAAEIEGDGISGDQLDILLEGAGNITLNDLQVKELNVNIPGVGTTQLSGQAESQTVEISGAGNYNGENLQSATASVEVAGVGKATVWVTETLDVTISGVGGVNYYGEPEVTKSGDGLGKVTAKGPKEASN